MPLKPEYHHSVRHSTSLWFLNATLLAMPMFLGATAQAQINGVPSSVTSTGFGGRQTNGTPASVTSLGPRGYGSNPRVTFSTTAPLQRSRNGQHRHPHYGQYYSPYLYAVPVPYAVDESAVDTADSSNDAYEGGPTVFDRRGSGVRSYVPPVRDASPSPSAEAASDRPPDSTPNQDPTLLVFKDGHKLEVGNYAIVGATLFDLTPGHSRRIAIADLDVEATRRQNDDRGVLFELPPSLHSN